MRITKDFLTKIPYIDNYNHICPICHSTLRYKQVDARVYDYSRMTTTLKNLELLNCDDCGIFLCNKYRLNSIRKSIAPYEVIIFPILKRLWGAELLYELSHEDFDFKIYGNKPKQHFNHQRIDLPYQISDNIHKVFIYVTNTTCLDCKNLLSVAPTMTPWGIYVKTIKNNEVLINANRCESCGEFYVNYYTLQRYEKKYGTILVERIKTEDFFLNFKSKSNPNYNEDSILSRNGYVADGTMDTKERQDVIKHILDNNIGSKAEIQQILSGFIEKRGDRCPYAKPLWEADLAFTSDYNIENQSQGKGELSPKSTKIEVLRNNPD